ncbi:3-hydroxyacyl-CoA dehydrogenase/enoyl-CoA hydratase family protein [Desulforhopalus singaporensis]|uniref:3-hydroxyacyl-CoA dehydrogenase n=1 Tax=Desulforhopalus singaporensis TaxID=91360 RepID=A0A1H0Q798_9BACT|nr:3-hydroxyacyl-CoA dehydrogenase/enoyl-CoA hydratase family protein [Desulforhopalus singaporensis]SDP12558.1 3-hydroxyacyl-CoA dehydrogenase [Desulforhopalus singaporensis]
MQQLKQAAVLGAGVMGAGIAAQLANGGMKVLLLDMVPQHPDDREKAEGLTIEDRKVRNRLAESGIKTAAKTQGFYSEDARRLVTAGNFDDDIEQLQECDWVIEAVIENMDIKKHLFREKVVCNLKPGAILTTNTSGLSINEMAATLPQEVRSRFMATHFFNPPRFMRLLELVPAKETDPELLENLAEFCSRRLGKGIVRGKDTPNFIANRIGVFSLCNALHHMEQMGLSVEQVDAVFGPATARPNSALCRLFDLIGVDTMVLVAENSYRLLESDESREVFRLPAFVRQMVDEGLIGRKARQGFYRRQPDGTFMSYDYRNSCYRPLEKPEVAVLAAVKKISDPGEKLKTVLAADDPASRFVWLNLRDTLLYTVRRIPEIADEIVAVDQAMRWGYSWSLGPFEMLDAIGVKSFIDRVKADGLTVPNSLEKVDHFYGRKGSTQMIWDLQQQKFIPPADNKPSLDLRVLRRTGSVVAANNSASIHDLKDGVFGLEFHSKMNSLDTDTVEMVHRAVERAEREGVGLVIANHGRTFSAGANLSYMAEAIESQDFKEIESFIRRFQGAVTAIKYCAIPVVAAPFGLTLGGGCEIALHADSMAASAETCMGLVEVGVGLIPAGGGTKEMSERAMLLGLQYDVDPLLFLEKFFRNMVHAKTSAAADQLFAMGYLRRGDSVVMDQDRLIPEARQKVIALAGSYRQPHPPAGLRAAGRSAAASLMERLHQSDGIKSISDYDLDIAGQLAAVMTGGDVAAGTAITEQHLLDLELEVLLRLCGNPKTLERIRHTLKTGKTLKN